MKQIDVKVPQVEAYTYPIVIGVDILSELGGWLDKEFGNRKRFIVTDRNLEIGRAHV